MPKKLGLDPNTLDNSWMILGACAHINPAKRYIFFPGSGETTNETKAKEYCNRCPVRLKCLNFAILARETKGVWGGLSEIERKRLIRKRRIAHKKPA